MFAVRTSEDRLIPFPFLKNICNNWGLFYSILIGAISVFPAVYIPVVSRTVFKHAPIDWEWGLAVSVIVVFVSRIERWKAFKRRYGWLRESVVFSTYVSADRKV